MLRVTATEEITRTAEGEVVRWPRNDWKVRGCRVWIVWMWMDALRWDPVVVDDYHQPLRTYQRPQP